MISLHPVASPRMRCKPLAACIAALCGLSASTAMASGTVWNVTSCNDDGGIGTLRNIILTNAASGDTVDLSGLACSTISLASGATAIIVQQGNLRIQKTGNDHITIDGTALKGGETNTAASRIFTHVTAGTLTVQGVTLKGGHVYHLTAGAYGGCIRSVGNVELINSTVTSCSAHSGAPASSKFNVYGGGIFASGNVTLTSSTVSDNSATSAHYLVKGGGIFASGNVQATHSTISGNYSKGSVIMEGGGIFAAGDVTSSYSTVSGNELKTTAGSAFGGGIYLVSGNLSASYSAISGNSVLSPPGYGAGGAVFAKHGVTLRKSTISNNYSSEAIGGIAAISSSSNTNQFYMIASTVSGNSAGSFVGGVGVNSATTKIYNSTIAFNTAAAASANDHQVYGPGLALNSTYGPMSVKLSSNLLSNNTYGPGTEGDLSTANTSAHAITFNTSPANNFVRASYVPPLDASQLPDDTLSGSCPLLGPLRNNGGPTLTHALLSGSIAIDQGNNAKSLTEDQRGVLTDTMPFKYPLPSGLVADIGAYEVNHSDIVFNGAFDGCPDLL